MRRISTQNRQSCPEGSVGRAEALDRGDTSRTLATVAVLHIAETDAASMSIQARLRTMLDAAFDGDFTKDDWEHSFGGVHVWLTES
jgi:hypothetical protein